MKLACDLCGGVLRLNGDGQVAVCQGCGLEYSLEVLRKKCQAGSSAAPTEETPKTVPKAPAKESAKTASETSSKTEPEAEPVCDTNTEPVAEKDAFAPELTRDKVLNIWRRYLPQVMPGYSINMSVHRGLKGCYIAPDIPADCAQRASRHLTKGKVAPQDILGHYSFKPQGGLAGIVVAEDRMFLPTGKLGMSYLEIVYADISRAEVKKEESHKIRTEVSLVTYSNELTLYYKNGRVNTFTTNAQYNAAVIAKALNLIVG